MAPHGSPNGSSARQVCVLIVDDDKDCRRTLTICLEDIGCEVLSAATAEQALAAAAQHAPDLALVDLKLGLTSGLDLVPELLAVYPNLPVVVLTGCAAIDVAVEAVKRGAADFLAKPYTPKQIRQLVVKLIGDRNESHPAAEFDKQLRRAVPEILLQTRSPKMEAVLEMIDRAAESDAPVLLHGEAGVGKEVLARALHAKHRRHAKPFVTVACQGAAEESLARQLFGWGKLTFVQNAPREQPGAVELGAGGTLFLDSVGDFPASLQPKLLRLLQEQRFERIGESQPRRADVRVVAAARGDLANAVAAGRFDQDLYFRLNVIEVHVPPLRERSDDVLPLARHFLTFFAKSLGRSTPKLSTDAEEALTSYDWPGNLRELRNAMQRAVTLWPAQIVERLALPERLHSRHALLPEFGGDFTLEEIERRHVLALLARNDKLDEVARTLGIDVSTLWRKRKKYENT